MLGKLAAMAIPPWAIILILGSVVGGIFGGGVWLGVRLQAGTVAEMQIELDRTEYKVTERDRQLVIRDESLAAIRTTLEDAEKARDAADARYFEEVAKEPETVTRWRTAAAEVPDVVVGETCVEQVASAIDHLKAVLGDGGSP